MLSFIFVDCFFDNVCLLFKDIRDFAALATWGEAVTTCVSIYFVGFLFGKVYSSFNDIRDDFGLIFSKTKFYVNNHNFCSDNWIMLNFSRRF